MEGKNKEYQAGVMKYEDLLEYLLKLREKEQSVTDEEKKQRVFTEKQFEVLN